MPSAGILEQKKAIVAEIKEELKDAKTIVLVDYRGITVEQDTEFRATLRKENVVYKVIKNNILKLVMKELGIEGVDEFLKGPTAIAFNAIDVVAPAKVVNDSSKKINALEIKSGIMEGKVVSIDEIKAIAALPSKDALLASLASVLNENITAFARVIDAIVKKDGGDNAAETPAEATTEAVAEATQVEELAETPEVSENAE